MRATISTLLIVLGAGDLTGAGAAATDPRADRDPAGELPRVACARPVDDLVLGECGAWDIPCRISDEARRALEAAAAGAYREARRALFSRTTGLDVSR